MKLKDYSLMLCKHCGKKIPLLKRLSDTEFCSPVHRVAFMQMEQDAAMARLMQSGSMLGPAPQPAAQPEKSKQGPKKRLGKDEIPAPLAGLVRDVASRPKRKIKTLNRPVVHDWAMERELPQSTLVVQARRLDIAGRIPLETQPARTAHVAHAPQAAAAGEVAAVEQREPAGKAPLVEMAGPRPVRAAGGWMEMEPGWRSVTAPMPELVRLAQGVSGGEIAEQALMELPGAGPVAVLREARGLEAGRCETKAESRGPRMRGGIQPRVENAAVEAGENSAASDADNRAREVEPAQCGPVGMKLAGVAAAASLRSVRAQMLERQTSDPLAPGAGIVQAAAEMCAPAGLMELEMAAGQAAICWHRGVQKALRPKRRLLGPRVRRAASGLAAVTEAGLAAIGGAEPVRAGQTRICGAVQPAVWEPRQPVKPAARAMELEARPGWAGLAGIAGAGRRPVGGRAAAMTEVGPVWAVRAELIPVAGLGVEQWPVTAPEACAEAAQEDYAVAAQEPVQEREPELQGPPMFDRQFPLFASRGLVQARRTEAGAGFAEGPSWVDGLKRPPAMRGSALTVDHADGSGSRAVVAELTAKRPWRSIQLPHLNFASWRSAPADFKWIMVALPMILLIALYSFLPPRTKNSVDTASGTRQQPTVLSQRLEAIRTAIMERAAIKLADDFRSGLGAWQGTGGWAQTWTYNSSNYAVPGQLAFYQPSLGLRDYVFSFLGQVDRRSINWVVRARDERNYVAMRIVMTRSGPLPAASLVRYAVTDGKAGKQTALPLPMTFRDGTMQQVEVTVAGDTITTRVMGQIVDSFTEDGLDSGGVGFFSPKGDRALLRWISITHQYDYVGRLCALLAPHSVMSHNARRME